MSKSIDIILNAKDNSLGETFRRTAENVSTFQRAIVGLNGIAPETDAAIRRMAGSLKQVPDAASGLGDVGAIADKSAVSVANMVNRIIGLGSAFTGLARGDISGAKQQVQEFSDEMQRLADQLRQVDEGVTGRAMKPSQRANAADIQKLLDENKAERQKVNKRVDEIRDAGSFGNNPLTVFTELENLKRSNKTLLAEKEQLEGRLKEEQATGKYSDDALRPGENNFWSRMFPRALGNAATTKIDSHPLKIMEEQFNLGAANVKRAVDAQQKVEEKRKADLEELRKESLTPKQEYEKRAAEIDKAEARGDLGKTPGANMDAAAELRQKAKLKLATDLGIEANAPGPKRFGATESRFLNRGEGFEEPSVAIAKQQLAQQQKQNEVLGKINGWLEQQAKDKPKILKAG